MDFRNKVVIVTGGAKGIGAALVEAIFAEGAATLIVSDLDGAAAKATAARYADSSTKVVAKATNVSISADITDLVSFAEQEFGRVDIICSNAGLMTDGDIDVSDERWAKTWDVNVMAHVRIARAALPGMIARGEGYFVNVASAAGLLTAPGAVAYTTTKHAAVGFAEWMAISHGDQGIGFSVVCPGAVGTDMLATSLAIGNEGVRRVAETSIVLTADNVAKAIVTGVKEGRFLIFPHTDTLKNVQRKWSDVDRWINGMRNFLRIAA